MVQFQNCETVNFFSAKD